MEHGGFQNDYLVNDNKNDRWIFVYDRRIASKQSADKAFKTLSFSLVLLYFKFGYWNFRMIDASEIKIYVLKVSIL